MRSLGVLICVILSALVIIFLVPKITGSFEAAQINRCKTHLDQIGQALRAYHDSNKSFPPVVTYGQLGQPLLSWRVLLLPYLREENLYHRFDFTEPWDGSHNIKLMREMPKLFSCPFDSDANDIMTSYVVVTGEETLFPPRRTISLHDVTDDPSHTVAVVEIGSSQIPWTKPQDLYFTDISSRGSRFAPSPRGWGMRAVLFVDGHVGFLSQATNSNILQSLFTIQGHEAIDSGDY